MKKTIGKKEKLKTKSAKSSNPDNWNRQSFYTT